MTEEQIQYIKKSLLLATPAPWIYQQGCYGRKSIVHQEYNDDMVCSIAENLDGDGHLIANAPTWLNQLLEALEEKEKKLKQTEEESRGYRIAMREEIEISAQVVCEREELIIQNETLQQQQKQLIEALEFYADEEKHRMKHRGKMAGYRMDVSTDIAEDNGYKARTALQLIQGNK